MRHPTAVLDLLARSGMPLPHATLPSATQCTQRQHASLPLCSPSGSTKAPPQAEKGPTNAKAPPHGPQNRNPRIMLVLPGNAQFNDSATARLGDRRARRPSGPSSLALCVIMQYSPPPRHGCIQPAESPVYAGNAALWGCAIRNTLLVEPIEQRPCHLGQRSATNTYSSGIHAAGVLVSGVMLPFVYRRYATGPSIAAHGVSTRPGRVELPGDKS